VFVGNELQVAGLGGDARDLRVQPEIRGYVPISKRVTFAVRASTGFLFPDNYGTTFADQPGAAELSDPAYLDRRSRDIQLVYFRAFFSGGPSSNRGYPFRGVGPHGVVPFFHPGLAARALAAQCDPHGAAYDEVRCAVPLGGLSLWEASAEIRWRVVGPFLTSTFCDASDVTTQRLTLRIDHPHLSCGLGVRYDTPVGPLRLDVGWRLPGLQVPAGTDPRVEGDPGTLFGAPVAVALGIGEAF
jgi:outer membrane protein insertion porin family/translocation and assembly module TamA